MALRQHDAVCVVCVCSRVPQGQPTQLAAAQESLLNSKITPSFASQNPTFEGCCMGNRKTCKCGDPFLG